MFSGFHFSKILCLLVSCIVFFLWAKQPSEEMSVSLWKVYNEKVVWFIKNALQNEIIFHLCFRESLFSIWTKQFAKIKKNYFFINENPMSAETYVLVWFMLFLLRITKVSVLSNILWSIYNGPTNSLVCIKTLIQMSHTKTFEIAPTCFDHQMIIIMELSDPG
jgi:hypothetical protein